VAKIKGKRGFRFVKELGGAMRRQTASRTALVLKLIFDSTIPHLSRP
jgi:hypothetical protein